MVNPNATEGRRSDFRNHAQKGQMRCLIDRGRPCVLWRAIPFGALDAVNSEFSQLIAGIRRGTFSFIHDNVHCGLSVFLGCESVSAATRNWGVALNDRCHHLRSGRKSARRRC
eukprot:scaffold41566_cov34-Tisochrysis_lutea.AAC.8